MAASLAAISLARALSTLGRAQCTGVVCVTQDLQERRVALVQGQVRSVVLSGRAGAGGGHWRPLPVPDLGEPLCAEVASMFAWSRSSFRFEVGLSSLGSNRLGSPLSAADLVLAGMREATGEADVPALLREQTALSLELSAWGRTLIGEATLSAAERLWLLLLQRGAATPQLTAASSACRRVQRTWAALWAYRAIVRSEQAAPDYALLLRKRRQLRSHASPAELLDLSAEERASPQAARRALRRLARKLHPDVLGPDTPPAVHKLSTELMSALLRAEAELRAEAPSPRRQLG
jgi:Domain of unknown function (DUF4388)